ncbi:hypothetical protein [Clostridium sp.]|uniref:hypothetical protein n=1 Tax=Clostridium sp. TaxID=1506 RepID=UPI00290697B6|nr:hypothetical protein [Clostridium sp.]MDU4478587.1 hypothetical protein [Clostridium sp.]
MDIFAECKDCKKRECEYREVNFFVNQINNKCENGRYEFEGCLDRGGRHSGESPKGTSDLYYINKKLETEIYIEVKRVFYGNKELNVKIANERSVQVISDIISSVIDWLDSFFNNNEIRRKISELYMICIPNVEFSYTNDNEISNFASKFLEYLLRNYFLNENKLESLKEFVFNRDEKHNKIIITFERKSEDVKNKLEPKDDSILFAVDANSNNSVISVEEIRKVAFDYPKIISAFKEEIKKCGIKKFENCNGTRVVLLVLRVTPTLGILLDGIFEHEEISKIFIRNIKNQFDAILKEYIHMDYPFIDQIYFAYSSDECDRLVLLYENKNI